MSNASLLLIHWNASEAEERAARLRALGFDTRHAAPGGMAGVKAMTAELPDAFVIDLERLPSQGRAVAVALRGLKATRQIPLLFVGGQPEKVGKTREILPDAVFSSWENIGEAVVKVLKNPPAAPVVPRAMAEYASVPLARKLGMRAGSTVALLGAPAGFAERVGRLPEHLRFTTRAESVADLVLLFVRTRRELETRFDPAVRSLSDGGAVWILWPKKTSRANSDLSQTAVRAFGLTAGFVDYKICAVDEVWSGLLFARRRKRKGREMS